MTEYAQLETPEAVRAALERGEAVEMRLNGVEQWYRVEPYALDSLIEAAIRAGKTEFRAPLPAAEPGFDLQANYREGARLVDNLRKELPHAKMTHTFTFTRDELLSMLAHLDALPAAQAAVGPVSLNHVDTLKALRGDCNPEGDDWDRQICAALDVAISALAATPAPPEKSKADGDWRTSGLIEALKVRKQIDEDGTLIGVSHQALDEATKILEAIAAEPAPLSEQGKADRDLFLLGTSFMVGGKRVDPARVTIERKAGTREAVAEQVERLAAMLCDDFKGPIEARYDDRCQAGKDRWREKARRILRSFGTTPATPDLLARLGELADRWREGNGDYPESLQDCADELRALIAGAQK